jgi:magnesium chelatase family protein
MDRIDLHIDVKSLPIHQFHKAESSEDSATIRKRVITAREIQTKRFNTAEGTYTNAQMNSGQLKQYCQVDSNSQKVLLSAMHRLQLSARAYDRILKVARTIADLAGSETILIEHLSEAIQFRSLDKDFTDQYSDAPKKYLRRA